MMKLLSYHLTGNENVKAAIMGLSNAGLLNEFHVAIASVPGTVLDCIGGIGPFSEIRRRRFDPAIKPHLHIWPWFELGRILALKTGVIKLTNVTRSPFHIDAVIQNFDKHIANRIKQVKQNGVDTIYGYEDMSLFTFREAKSRGLKCLYDLPIGYWRAAQRLLDNERQRWPEWVNTMPGFSDSEQKLANKDEELRLADRIFVASTFTAETLKDFPDKLSPIEIIPYGFPAISNEERVYINFKSGRPLRLLYVGSLSQRKGIAGLFEAVESFGNRVELTLVGQKITEDCPPLNKALKKHTWIPSMPNTEILKLMRKNDVFVFPSLFEGFGLVITEAMSQGTPVITTERTAGPDIIEHGKNGWLIQAGLVEPLKQAIEGILLRPERIEEVGRAATETARLRPWGNYGKELADAISR